MFARSPPAAAPIAGKAIVFDAVAERKAIASAARRIGRTLAFEREPRVFRPPAPPISPLP